MDTIGAVELVEATGATYRQIDSWTRSGLLPVSERTPGSGFPRRYHPEAIPIARALVRWSSVANGERHRIIEAVSTGGAEPVALAPGIYVVPAELVS